MNILDISFCKGKLNSAGRCIVNEKIHGFMSFRFVNKKNSHTTPDNSCCANVGSNLICIGTNLNVINKVSNKLYIG